LVAHTKGGTDIKEIREKGAEENIWTPKKDEVIGDWRKLLNEGLNGCLL
jgi:hypothetical protein